MLLFLSVFGPEGANPNTSKTRPKNNNTQTDQQTKQNKTKLNKQTNKHDNNTQYVTAID
jgi:hypothetical protein